MRKPIQNLIERGLVAIKPSSGDNWVSGGKPPSARQKGKGTFVTQPKITQELTELTGFVEDMQALGRTATARLLDKRIVATAEAVAHHLALAPGRLVVRLRRVRLADGVAMSLDETYLPRDFGEKVAENDLEAEPVFVLLEDKYYTPLVEAEYKLEAAAADAVAAQALQVPAGSPIFLIERTSYTTGNRPVDYERLHYRGDLMRFVTRLARRPRASMLTGGAEYESRLCVLAIRRALDRRLGTPKKVENILRLGIGIAVAAFHTQSVASQPHREARVRFLVRGEVGHETEKRVAHPRG